jgi:hypothetical protein
VLVVPAVLKVLMVQCRGAEGAGGAGVTAHL